MSTAHRADDLCERLLSAPLVTDWPAVRDLVRDWYDAEVGPMRAQLHLARTLLGNTLYNIEQIDPSPESEARLRSAVADIAERLGLSRERGWR